MRKRLGIAVPTYNRANCLSLLLKTLEQQLKGLETLVDVIVSDNGSTDGTHEVMSEWKVRWPTLVWIVNEKNLGPDENFCGCIERLDTQYFWILGDDDLPKSGVIHALLNLIQTESPDMVYMQSEWMHPLIGPDQGEPVAQLRFETLDQVRFARKVHVWLTFISGIVVNRETLVRSGS